MMQVRRVRAGANQRSSDVALPLQRKQRVLDWWRCYHDSLGKRRRPLRLRVREMCCEAKTNCCEHDAARDKRPVELKMENQTWEITKKK
jgi:hypothetical protein